MFPIGLIIATLPMYITSDTAIEKAGTLVTPDLLEAVAKPGGVMIVLTIVILVGFSFMKKLVQTQQEENKFRHTQFMKMHMATLRTSTKMIDSMEILIKKMDELAIRLDKRGH